jgi:hypothetical protein
MRVWTGLDWLRIGSSDGVYERGNQSYRSIHGWEFLDDLNKIQILEKDCAPCD